jgi:hypothetical protein
MREWTAARKSADGVRSHAPAQRSPAEQVLALQRTAGNRATTAALRNGAVPAARLLQRRRWWQFWKPRNAQAAAAAAPVAPVAPMPAPAAKVQFGATSVWIQPANDYMVGANPGNYVADVTQHLTNISAHVNAAFWAGLASNGKTQNIIYGGPNSNQCAGGLGGYKKLRKWHDSTNAAQFGVELAATLNNAHQNAAWLAAQLQATGLPHWNNTIDAAPIAPFADAGTTTAKVGTWLAGAALPTVDEMDVLMLVLEPYADNGNGVGSRINYDPQKVSVASGPRPPEVALFHELVHAFYNAQGAQLGREDSSAEDVGGRLFELMSVGLPPFDTRPYSENAMRAAWPCALRPGYP